MLPPHEAHCTHKHKRQKGKIYDTTIQAFGTLIIKAGCSFSTHCTTLPPCCSSRSHNQQTNENMFFQSINSKPLQIQK